MLAQETAVTRAKSPEAFLTISEASVELDVPQHVLRFWESRFAQVKPIKRAGGRRYYRPEDVDLLRGIRALLYSDGFTIRGVQKILRDKGLRHVAQVGRALHGEDLELDEDSSDADEPTSDIDEDLPVPSEERRHELDEAPSDADDRNSLVMLERERVAPTQMLAQEQRAKLELLLAELLQLKSRLRAARA